MAISSSSCPGERLFPTRRVDDAPGVLSESFRPANDSTSLLAVDIMTLTVKKGKTNIRSLWQRNILTYFLGSSPTPSAAFKQTCEFMKAHSVPEGNFSVGRITQEGIIRPQNVVFNCPTSKKSIQTFPLSPSFSFSLHIFSPKKRGMFATKNLYK
jgi:hypothetical protein